MPKFDEAALLKELECPISAIDVMYAMLHGKFTGMTDSDYDAFAGIEHEGYIGEIDDLLVILDVGPSGTLVNVSGEDDAVWSFTITCSSLEKIV